MIKQSGYLQKIGIVAFGSVFIGLLSFFALFIKPGAVQAYSCRDVRCCDIDCCPERWFCGDCCSDIEDPCDRLPAWSRRCQDDAGSGGGGPPGGGGGIDLDVKFRYEDATHGTQNNIYDDDDAPVPDPTVRGDMSCGDYALPPIYVFRGSAPSPMPSGNIYPNECLRFRTTTGSDTYTIVVPSSLFIKSFLTRVYWSNGEVHDIMSPAFLNLTNVQTSGGYRTYTFTVNGTWAQIYNLYNNPSGGQDYKLKVLLSTSPPTSFEPSCTITLNEYLPAENPVRVGINYQLDTHVNVGTTAVDAPREYSFEKTGAEEWTIKGYNFWENQVDYGSGPTGVVAVYLRYKTCNACGYLEWQGVAPVTNGNPLDTLVITNDPWSAQIPSDFDPYVDFYYLRIGMASTSISRVNYAFRNPDGTPNTSFSLGSPSVTTPSADDWDEAWYRNTFTPLLYSAGTINLHTEVEMMTRTGDQIKCSNIIPLTIDGRLPWYQFRGGDAITVNGNIASKVPTEPAPGNELVSTDYLGLPIFGGQLNPPNSQTNIGDPGWKVDAVYKGHQTVTGANYDYNYFFSKINPTVDHFTYTFIPPPLSGMTNAQFFASNPGIEKDGYHIYYQGNNGPLTILGGIDLRGNGSQKIIIIASNLVAIDGKILLDDGVDFFMIVALGDIQIRPSTGDPAPYVNSGVAGTEDLEGIYITNGKFITNSNLPFNSSNQLIVRGIVASFYNGADPNGIVFQRDLIAGNVDYPAEIFQFAPDQLMLFPPFFSEKNIIWKEVSP